MVEWYGQENIALISHTAISLWKTSLGCYTQTVSDHYVAEGIGGAFVSDLTLGLSGDISDKFDYSVTVTAGLKIQK